MKCVPVINNFDFLSHEVKLTIDNNNNTRLKSCIGGILSILSIMIMVAFCLLFFIKLVQKDSTFVTISSESSSNSNISDSNNYPFMIRLTDKQNKPFTNPDQIFKIYLKYWYGGSTNLLENVGQKTVDITIEPCDLHKHFGKYKDLFEDITDLNTFYCPVPRPENETIYGRYGDINPFGYYHFYVSMCMNSNANANACLALNDIKKITENVYLDFRTVDYTIDNLRSNAKVKIVRTDRHMLSSTVYKRIWVYLNSIKYITDTGLFFTFTSIEYFSQFDSMRYDIDLRDIFTGTIPGTFVTMTILNTGNTMIYNRNYLKLQEYLASVGGIAKFIQLVAFLLNYTFSRNTYYMKLITDLQEGHNPKRKETSKNVRSSNPLMTNMIACSIEPKLELNDSKDYVNRDKISQVQLKSKKKNALDDRLYKWYYKLLPLIALNKKERDLYMKCIEAVNAQMNITTILTKLEDAYLFAKASVTDRHYTTTKQLLPLQEANTNKKKTYNIPLKNINRSITLINFANAPNN